MVEFTRREAAGADRARYAARVPGERLGDAFRLLMRIRIVLAITSLLMVPYDRQTVSGAIVVTGVALLSWLGLVAWEQIVAWLVAHPVLIAVDICVAYGVLERAGVVGPFFLFTVITSLVAGLLYRWPGRILVFVLQMLVYYGAAVGAPDRVADVQTFLVMPVFYPVAGFVGAGLRHLFDQYDVLDEMRRRAEVAAAAADERSRLAREMHDSLAKTLRGIAMSAAALPTWVSRSPSRAEEEARRIAAAVEIASREARRLISDLREDIVQRPLDESLGSVVAEWERSHGVRTSVVVEPAIDLTLRTRYELVAILKEALENVARHAQASSVEVRLTQGSGVVLLRVRDDGRGFDRPGAAEDSGDFGDFAREGHYGLVGMRERAAEVGAELTITSASGSGTTVDVAFPALAPAPGDGSGDRLRRLDAA